MTNQYVENIKSIWGIIIFLIIPWLIYLVGFVIQRRTAKGHGTIPPKIMRFLVLPTVAFHLILLKIFEIPTTDFILKITETILTIFIISFLFNAINYLFFSEYNILTKEENIPKLGRDVLHFVLILFVSACVLSNVWGLDLGNLLTALGVSSLVLGLALQEPLGNLFNGIAILMAKPFQKGDWISVGDDTGKVVEHNWRSVKINNGYNELIIIPNNMLGKEKIKNLSKPNKIHAELVSIGFSYKDSPIAVKKVLLQEVNETEGILKAPKADAVILSFDNSAITYGIKYYIEDFEKSILIKDALLTKSYTAAAKHHFTMPYPQLDVLLRKEES